MRIPNRLLQNQHSQLKLKEILLPLLFLLLLLLLLLLVLLKLVQLNLLNLKHLKHKHKLSATVITVVEKLTI